MILINCLILSLAICIDSFLLCFINTSKKKSDYFFKPFLFTLFQTLFILIGYHFGNFIEEYIKNHLKYVNFIIFSSMGLKIMIDTLLNKGKEKTCQLTLKIIFLQAILTSFDSLFLGLALAFKNINCLILIIITSATTILTCLLGLLLRNKLKDSCDDKISIIGAIILFTFAFKSLI